MKNYGGKRHAKTTQQKQTKRMKISWQKKQISPTQPLLP